MLDNKSTYIAIIVALIGLVGTLGAVVIDHYLEERRETSEKEEQKIQSKSAAEDTKELDTENTMVSPPSHTSSENDDLNSLQDYVYDPDENRYKVIHLAGKTWLAENLNYNISGSYCYDDDPEICKIYGKLYTWKAAKKGCAFLGNGWRLPSDEEWKELAIFFGGYFDFEQVKAIGKPAKPYEALIEGGHSGFNALLGGARSSENYYLGIGSYGDYWCSKRKTIKEAWCYGFGSDRKVLFRDLIDKDEAQSVRCIKD